MNFTRTHRIAMLVLALAAITCMEQARLVSSLLARYTNEDHTLLWNAATDWAQLRIREPTFYGQPYGVTFEAIPMAMLHAVGQPYGTALPVSLIGMAVAAWWLLAWAAFRRGFWLPAIAAAAAPVLLNTDHWIVVGVIGTGVGRLLAAAAAAVCLGARPRRGTVFVAIALACFSIVIDTAAAVLAGPMLVWSLSRWLRARRFWLPIAMGTLPALGWRAFTAWFEQFQPDHLLHPSPLFDPDYSVMLQNLEYSDRLLATQAPELLSQGTVILAILVLALALAAFARAWRELASVVCCIALIAGLMALPKSLDGLTSLWFPSARMTLAVPMGLWFVTTVTFQAAVSRFRDRLPPRASTWLFRMALVAWVTACVATITLRTQTWQPRMAAVMHEALRDGQFPLRTVEEIDVLCRDAARAADKANTFTVIFPYDRAANYACAALYPALTTAYPGYERRYWVLQHLATSVQDRMLVWGVDEQSCTTKRFRRALTACAAISGGRGLRLDFEPKPPLDVLHAIRIDPRPFGPGCNPNMRETCHWWSARFGR